MKTNTLIGIILIVLGMLAFAYQGISVTTKEKDLDIGPIQVTHNKTTTLPLPPVVGAITLVCGVVMLLTGNRRSL
jgi:hypothetical protein